MKKSLFLALLLSFSVAQAATDKTISAVELNNQAVHEIEKENTTGITSGLTAAQDDLIKALGKSPENSTVHLNLGFVLEKAGQPDKAQASYEQALKFAKDPEGQFAALFNLGELAQKAQKTDEALGYYQQALLSNPESKETKVNIELLMKQQDQNKESKDNKDKKDDQKKDQKKDNKDNKDKDNKQSKDQNKDQNKDQKKEYGHQPQPKPQFKSDQLNQADVNKILGELKQQEQRIRAEYNRKESKERPNDKDW